MSSETDITRTLDAHQSLIEFGSAGWLEAEVAPRECHLNARFNTKQYAWNDDIPKVEKFS